MGEPREHPGLQAPGRAGGGVPKAGAEAPRAWLVASGPGARHRRASQLGGGGAGCPPRHGLGPEVAALPAARPSHFRPQAGAQEPHC